MKKALLLFPALFSLGIATAQPVDYEQAMSLLRQGDQLIESEEFGPAAPVFREALLYFEATGNCERTAYCYLWLGEAAYGTGKYSQALELGLQSEKVANGCSQPEQLPFYSMILQNIGVFYSKLGDFDRQMQYYQRAFEVIINNQGRESKRGADAYYNLGMAFGRRNRWDKAISYFDTSLQIAERLDYLEGVASIYLNLSYAYSIKKDYIRAIDYQKRALKLTTLRSETAQGYNNLGMLYHDTGQDQLALDFLERSLKLRREIYDGYYDEVFSTLLNLCRVHFDSGNHEQASHYIDQVLENLKTADGESQSFLKVAYHYKALMLQKMGLLEEAERYARLAMQIDGRQLDIDASTMLVMSDVMLAQGRYSEGLEFIQTALEEDVAGFHPTSLFDNPPLHRMEKVSVALDLLSQKARLLSHRGARDQSENDLSQALNTYLLADSIVTYSRRTYQDHSSKEILAADARDLYAGAVAAGYEIYKISGDDAYLDLVFTYSEKNKSLLVLEKMHDLYAKNFYGIPAETVDRERQLLQEIEFYSNKIKASREQPAVDTGQIGQWEDLLFDKRREQAALLKEISERYPAYYQLKHDLHSATPAGIQSGLLQEEEMLIEYFSAGSILYIFLLGKEEKSFLKVPLPAPLNELVSQIRKSLVLQQDSFYKESYRLYRLLLEPVAEKIAGKSLVIVPDGPLGYIPFEVLLTSEVPKDAYGRHRELPYLIRTNPVRYLFSASLPLKSAHLEQNDQEGKVLAIAPEFDGSIPAEGQSGEEFRAIRSRLTPLPGSTEEIDLIMRRFEGDAWRGTKAHEERFKREAGRYKLLHISTHTLIDERFPSLSKLIFSKEGSEQEDGFLNAYELYNLHIPADLIVLSACNTGIGVIQEGEGIASLARAFAYAGSPNLVMSLWPVKDHTTPQLMDRFYARLAEGMPKYRALQEAKLSFLEEENDLFLHPFYWGSFIYAGNVQPISLEERHSIDTKLPVMAAGALLLVLSGFFWWRRRRRKSVDFL